MKKIDASLMLENSDARREFFKFFDLLDSILPEECGKQKVKMAQMVFFNLYGFLSSEFWGCLDSVAFMPFLCTGFGEHSEPNFKGLAKYWCHSEFKTPYSEIGNIPSLAQVADIMKKSLNCVVHGKNHFFVVDSPTQQHMETSFHECVSSVVAQLRLRIVTCQALVADGGQDMRVVWGNVAFGKCDEEELETVSKITESLRESLSDTCKSYSANEYVIKDVKPSVDDDNSVAVNDSFTYEDQVKLTRKVTCRSFYCTVLLTYYDFISVLLAVQSQEKKTEGG